MKSRGGHGAQKTKTKPQTLSWKLLVWRLNNIVSKSLSYTEQQVTVKSNQMRA